MIKNLFRGAFRAGAAVLASSTLLAFAQAPATPYPSKPIRLVVPYPAGGATDFFARTVFSQVGELLGQPIVIDNKPGAGTTIGSEQVAKSSPDGYTLLIGDMGTYALNASLYKRLRYSPATDFVAVSLTGRFPLFLVVNPRWTKANSMTELLATAKQSPGKLNYGAPGPGSPLHVAMDLFKQQAGIDLVAVPYKGGADAVKDLLAGQIQLMFLDSATALPYIRSGTLTALGVASNRRAPAAPEVPTVSEAGLPGFEAYAWQGFVAPKGTPPAVIAKLNASFATAMKDPGIQKKLADAGVEPLTSSPEQAAQYMASETQRWAQVIQKSNISLD
ncbi:MAG: tripartite tricarboxylate transporter substrate binding protein [Gammaproteobacteria bacterium]|nr:tripartite tricarboxylate transporter substrate binding protein [Gammaproteobacteria bacterium]MBU1441266.1 tripartite tricarboxylate transporter substrate binding protein [Gammaproteobacteria bacterium]MBU2288743.1 tripartite tricarboxylate transporter substrate binding protein [Gammaproteobacteria bacterium]MBU2408128.1 tripartite tricarboxylate transporter substrate binding protein [Gammaproteobacteria bacterium]